MFKTEEMSVFFPTLIQMFSNCFDVCFDRLGDIYPVKILK